MTLSSTVMSSNVAGTWKVRPMPATACASGEARVRSTPSNMIGRWSAGMSPARQLKKVDLPAPFGPIRPMISPSSTVRSAPATARKLPKAFETFLRLKQHGRASSLLGAMRSQSSYKPAGLEARDERR